MKKKIKEIILNVKLVLIGVLLMIAVISGFISEMWPKTKFNWPLAICVISTLLSIAMIKLL